MSTPWIIAFGCLWALVLLLAFVVLGTLERALAIIQRVDERAAVGGGVSPLTVMPRFELLDEANNPFSSEALIREPTLLLFMDAGCRACRELATELGSYEEAGRAIPLMVVVDDMSTRDDLSIPKQVMVFSQREGAISRLFDTRISPSAFVIDRGGLVLDSAVPATLTDLELLSARQRRSTYAASRPVSDKAALMPK